MHLCEEAMMRSIEQPHSRAYTFLGTHATGDRLAFRVRVPRADAVNLAGDFNGWSIHSLPLRPLENGVWETSVPVSELHTGDFYKFFVRRGDETFFLSDPYARATEGAPNDASVVSLPTPFAWRDDAFLAQRKKRATPSAAAKQPRNLYCLHPLLWLNSPERSPLDAPSLARELSSYVKQMGYTHVSLTAMAEADLCEAGAPRSTALFAPMRAQGAPDDWRSFVNGMHEAGVGVILEWNVEDRIALATASVSAAAGEPPSTEDKAAARELLVSNLLYWADEFHIDGFRLYGGDKLLLRALIEALYALHPDVLLLFADAKGREPAATTDDAVNTDDHPPACTHGEPLADRCAKARMGHLLRLTGYAEKATQAGEELGEDAPQGDARGVAWERLELLPVATLQRTLAELNHQYLSTPALWNNTDGAGHYRLLWEDGKSRAFLRRGRNGETVTVLCNRSDEPMREVPLPVPADGSYREAVNTDAYRFGGSGVTNGEILSASPLADGGGFGVCVSLAPHSALMLVRA